ncbi:hypothetical protein ACVIHH_002065 [Bradyrhizobium sp. USDA 4518]
MGGQDDADFYRFAGPGAKRRRMRLEEIPRSLTSRANRPKRPEPKHRQQETQKRETKDITTLGLKNRIRRATLQTNSFREVCAELEDANISVSGVTVSSVRSEMREIVRLLIEEHLIDERRLEQYLRQHQRDRAR